MKKKTRDKWALKLFSLAGTLFLVALFVLSWSYIKEHALTILIVSGAIMLILTLMGYFNKKKFMRGLRRKFK